MNNNLSSNYESNNEDKSLLQANSVIFCNKQSKLLNYCTYWIDKIDNARYIAYYVNNFHSEMFYFNLQQYIIFYKEKIQRVMNYYCLYSYEKSKQCQEYLLKSLFSITI